MVRQPSRLSASLEHKLAHCNSLPTLPLVARRLIDVTSKEEFALAEISEVVSQDMAIAAKVIATANTFAYRRGEASVDLPHAVSRLGSRATLMIALGFSLTFDRESPEGSGVDAGAFWRRSVASAGIARALARLHGEIEPEVCFLAALVQDIGVMAIRQVEPDTYADLRRSTHAEVCEAEISTLECDHSAVGRWLLSHWRLPDDVCELVALSHSFSELNLQLERVSDSWCVAASGLLADALLSRDQLETARLLAVVERIFGFETDVTENLLLRLADTVRETEKMFDTALVEEPLALLEASKQRLLALVTAETSTNENQRIAELEDRVSILEQQGKYDSLTGAMTRHCFYVELERAFSRAQQERQALSVMFIDADHFKRINDTYGHIAGDEVLRWLSATLIDAVSSSGYLGRYGGEEFVVLMPGVDSATATNLGHRICQLVESSTVDNAAAPIRLTVSIGVASNNDIAPHAHVKDLLISADQAMYFAKRNGRNQCIAASSLKLSRSVSFA